MSGIVGFVKYKEEPKNKEEIINNMCKKMQKNTGDKDKLFINSNIALGQKSFIKLDTKESLQPVIQKYSFKEFVIVFYGNIYNNKELREILIQNDFEFYENSDTEVLLKGYIYYGADVVKHLNGVFSFAIWNTKTKELFIARDHLGVKPLFYMQKENTIIFSSEIKAIFEYPGVEKIITCEGICELLGVGPAHTPGMTVYKDIFELKPGHFAIYNEYGLKINKYWDLESKPHIDDFKTTCEKTKHLLEDSISKQLIPDESICTFLSGGLDSSIMTYYTANFVKEKGMPPLDTYSVDYAENDKNFKKSDFQPEQDSYYIKLMNENTYSTHHEVILDTPELAEYLENAMIARDVPGMADVDSSLLLFCKEVKKEKNISIMGECADEVFCGYPWFFRKDALNSNTFPWSLAIQERQKLLNPKYKEKINLKEYIDSKYLETISKVEILDNDTADTTEKRKISYLTIKWFMQTLLDRGEKMSMVNGFEIRIPFCDYRLVEYLYNVPWEMKAYNGREKGLLRYIMKDILPEEIVKRKKSPYPKTHNPSYLKKVKEELTKIMKDINSPINSLFDRDYIIEILNTDGMAFTRPWFGQLMTGPQLMAYLCQVNMWLEKYNPRIEV